MTPTPATLIYTNLYPGRADGPAASSSHTGFCRRCSAHFGSMVLAGHINDGFWFSGRHYTILGLRHTTDDGGTLHLDLSQDIFDADLGGPDSSHRRRAVPPRFSEHG